MTTWPGCRPGLPGSSQPCDLHGGYPVHLGPSIPPTRIEDVSSCRPPEHFSHCRRAQGAPTSPSSKLVPRLLLPADRQPEAFWSCHRPGEASFPAATSAFIQHLSTCARRQREGRSPPSRSLQSSEGGRGIVIAVRVGKSLCGPWPQPCLGTPAQEPRVQGSELSLLCVGNTPQKAHKPKPITTAKEGREFCVWTEHKRKKVTCCRGQEPSFLGCPTNQVA